MYAKTDSRFKFCVNDWTLSCICVVSREHYISIVSSKDFKTFAAFIKMFVLGNSFNLSSIRILYHLAHIISVALNSNRRKKLKLIPKSFTNWYTVKNAVISPNFLVWKFCRKAQFPHSFRRISWNYAETVPFHKIYAPGN